MSKARGLADLGNVYNDGALSNRNLIINGAMGIDQRNAGVAVTAVNDTYTTDRWVSRVGGTGAYTAQQTAVTTPSGFTNAMEVVVTTADASLAAGDYYGIEHRIEGLNFARCAFGAANATDVTLSFWVKSSISGTFSGSIRNGGNNRSYVFEYTITSPTTDQLVTVTIPGDVTGTWLVTSGIGLSIWFDLGSGSTFQGTVDTWQGGLIVTTAGAVKLISTVSATWQITGVQLEVGDTATPFEHRSYGQELALCQRYYEVDNPSTPTSFSGNIRAFAYHPTNGSSSPLNRDGPFQPYKVDKRASATVTTYAYNGTTGAVSIVTGGGTDTNVQIRSTTSGFQLSSSTYRSLHVWFAWAADAEL